MRLRTKSRTCGLTFASAFLVAVGAVASTAPGQSYPLVGTPGSASVTIPAGGTKMVKKTPAVGHFLLMEMCADAGGVLLMGQNFGFIALRPGQTAKTPTPPGPPCIVFSTGFKLPRGEPIMCQAATSAPSNCSISWILEQ